MNQPTSKQLLLAYQHEDFVRKVASRYARPNSFEFERMIYIGTLALEYCATRYSPSMGIPFKAYAWRKLVWVMRTEAEKLSRPCEEDIFDIEEEGLISDRGKTLEEYVLDKIMLEQIAQTLSSSKTEMSIMTYKFFFEHQRREDIAKAMGLRIRLVYDGITDQVQLLRRKFNPGE